MNWGGIVAGGIGGGAAQAVDVAREGLQTDRRVDAARILSQIEEQKQMRLAEFAQNMARQQQTYNTSGAGGDELLAFSRRQGEQANEVALAGRRAEASDSGITQGMADRAGAVAKATGEAQTEQDIKRATAMLPMEIKKAYAVADAHARAMRANEKSPGAELQAKINAIEQAIGRPLNEQQKLGVFGLTNGESDTETVKETTYGKDGLMVETTHTQKRRPGAAAGEPPAPYQDGTVLKGKDGNVYVVRDGRPVPKTAAAPAPAPEKKAAGIVAAANGDPLAGLSRQQIRAKRAELQSELTRWGDQPHAAARVAEIKALLERIDNGQF